jgi:beta-fructofuranosidase
MKLIIQLAVLSIIGLVFTFGLKKNNLNAQNSGLPEEAISFREVLKTKNIKNYSESALALRRWMIKNDPHYPKYHFTAPESWINDPNGLIYHDGKYHLFYQYRPMIENGEGHWKQSSTCWGHAVSADLVHWSDWPVAIWPDTEYDSAGCWSGNSIVDDDGVVNVFYTGFVGQSDPPAPGLEIKYGMRAMSRDGLLCWGEKSAVLKEAPAPGVPVHHDAHVWKEDNNWYQLIGGTVSNSAWLYSSKDLQDWKSEGNIAREITNGGYFWEFPYLVSMGSKHLLMYGANLPYRRGSCIYWIGTFDKEQMVFKPEHSEPKIIDRGNYYAFNPVMVDDKGPGGSERRIMFGWVRGPDWSVDGVPYWQGIQSIPRYIHLVEDRLFQEPVEEMEKLRGRHYRIENMDEANSGLSKIRGDALEIQASFIPGDASYFGVKVRMSEDGQDFARVFFDVTTGKFGVDGPTIERNREKVSNYGEGSFNYIISASQQSHLKPGEPINLQIFLDRSVIEVYLNGAAYTARVFSLPEDLGLDLFYEGGQAKLLSMDIWEMNSIWE